MKKVFLDDLPKRGNTQVDWFKSIGLTVNFVYDEIKGEIDIIDYERFNKMSYIKVKYNNKIMNMNTSSFVKGAIGILVGSKTDKYFYKIGETIQDNNRKMLITDQIRIKNHKATERGYKYKCLTDGYIGEITEASLKAGSKCSVCSNKKIIKGINDINTTEISLVKYFLNIEDTYKYSHCSGVVIKGKCPNCGYEKDIKISDLYIRGFSCPYCGDGVSYPNKFVRSFLDQLNEQYIPEYSPNWAYIKHDNPKLNGKKKYDNYLINKKEIWEVHGLQHYKEGLNILRGKVRNVQEEQENDKIKENLAEQNDLKYIIIDARYSKMEYIKNSLLNLPEIQRYNLINIGWLKCHEYACSSLVKTVCDCWNNDIKNIFEISKSIKVGEQTIRKYLKQGSLLGWCDYDTEELMKGSGKRLSQNNNISIIQLSLTGEYISEFISAMEAEKILKIKSLNKHIGSCCKGTRNQAGKFR